MAKAYLNRRDFVKVMGLGAASMLVPGCNITAPTPKKKPNFVFFLVDDLGWKDLVCYGSSFYETPNIDKLAKTIHRVLGCLIIRGSWHKQLGTNG